MGRLQHRLMPPHYRMWGHNNNNSITDSFSRYFIDLSTHTQPFYSSLESGLCPGQPGWAGTRRNIHPLNTYHSHQSSLSASPSTMIHGILPVQFTCPTVFFHNISASFLWSSYWPGMLHFIRHPIIVFFSQYMPIPSQPRLYHLILVSQPFTWNSIL